MLLDFLIQNLCATTAWRKERLVLGGLDKKNLETVNAVNMLATGRDQIGSVLVQTGATLWLGRDLF